MIQLLDIRINERTKPNDLERIRRNQFDAIRELQSLPLSRAKIIADVTLADGIATPIPHGLGRRVRVFVSPWGNTAPIAKVSSDELYVTLTATGATVTVDLIVVPL